MGSDDLLLNEDENKKPAFSAAPYPLYTCEPLLEDVLRGHPASSFPSAAVYPPPTGLREGKTRCGCLYTQWGGDDDRQITLETIWQPLWHVKDVVPGLGELAFFQDPSEYKWDGRQSYSINNGQFNWPKRFHCWEIEFFLMTHYSGGLGNLSLLDASVSVQIGEKQHLRVPIALFQKRELVTWASRSYDRVFFPLPLPLYFPSMQNFCVRIHWVDKLAQIQGSIRCVLNGYLSREIP